MTEIKRGEIYYGNLCPVMGSEQGGVRPLLILQNDTGNRFSPTTIVAAITSKLAKNPLPTHIALHTECLPKESVVLLEQIRTIDKIRLGRCLGQIDEEKMKQIDGAIAVSLGIAHSEVRHYE